MSGPRKADGQTSPFRLPSVIGALALAVAAGFGLGLALCSDAEAHEPTVAFVNAADKAVVAFYISQPDDEYWGESHLSQDLEPNDGVAITADGHRNRCTYDLLAEFAGGDSRTWSGVNLCEGQYFAIRPPD